MTSARRRVDVDLEQRARLRVHRLRVRGQVRHRHVRDEAAARCEVRMCSGPRGDLIVDGQQMRQ
jgi:hypothetical protein